MKVDDTILRVSEGSGQIQTQKKLTYNCLNFSREKAYRSVLMKEPLVNEEVKKTLLFPAKLPSTHKPAGG